VLLNRSRQKLLNAVVFFARTTRHVGKIKLYKLLYLLDFEHFRQTGKSVTGLNYNAWKFGPVPIPLAEEWDAPEPDMAQAFHIEPERVYDYWRYSVVPNVEFDPSHFSKRELSIMNELAERYRDVFSPEMIDVTHAQNGAWSRVWNDGAGRDRRIDYELALSENDPFRVEILEAAREYASQETRH
jgi:uncharacterized phage-associated protein